MMENLVDVVNIVVPVMTIVSSITIITFDLKVRKYLKKTNK